MATSATPEVKERPGSFTWIATLVACVYVIWIGVSLYQTTGIFMNMLASMGMELGSAIKLLMGTYKVFYPALFGGAASLIVVKQFFVRDKWANLSVTLGIAVAIDFVSAGIVRALYSPILDMVEKLSK